MLPLRLGQPERHSHDYSGAPSSQSPASLLDSYG